MTVLLSREEMIALSLHRLNVCFVAKATSSEASHRSPQPLCFMMVRVMSSLEELAIPHRHNISEVKGVFAVRLGKSDRKKFQPAGQ